LNINILNHEVQAYINAHLKDDVHRLALSKSPFSNVTAQEVATQIAAKNKSEKKLPTWFNADQIYYPELISIEQCSSEKTAEYKASIILGDNILDLTGGLGVDCFYFSKVASKVTHCELIPELSAIAAHNAGQLGVQNIRFLNVDGMDYLQHTEGRFTTIYIDPARRGTSGKVFMLKDCTPNVIEHLDLLLSKASRVIIKTSPLLDISAGIKELKDVAEVQIISTKNACKELLFILSSKDGQSISPAGTAMEPDFQKTSDVLITSVTINEHIKKVSFDKEVQQQPRSVTLCDGELKKYLYEPDVALLKSGAFNAIGSIFDLEKLDLQTHLYTSDIYNNTFPGRIFEINEMLTKNDLKKEKQVSGNVIVRNYPGKPEDLIKTFKIKSSHDKFLIFTRINNGGYVILKASILQHY
jgi:16S rRNA G966 N2-methylase RsmD